MWFSSPFGFRSTPRPAAGKPPVARRGRLSARRARPQVEILEDRTVLSPVNVLVNNPAADATAQDTQSEAAIALAGSNVVIAYVDSGSNLNGVNKRDGYALSTDGGASFTDMGTLPTSANGDYGLPVLARDNTSGTIYLAADAYTNQNTMQLFRSYDNGATFTAPVNSAPGVSSSTTVFRPWLAVDNSPAAGAGRDNVYQAFTEGGAIGFSRSTDGGNTWSTQILGGTSADGGCVTVGPDHAVCVFFFDGSNAAGNVIAMRKSTDQGQTFSAKVTVATLQNTNTWGDLGLTDATGKLFKTPDFPKAAVNPATGALYVVYDDQAIGPDKGDVFFKQSTDGGTTWSAPVKLNDDITTNDQWQPTIAVTPNGKEVGVFWYDRRLDPADQAIDRYGVIGTVSGSAVAFGPNFRVTDQSFPAVVGQDSSVNQYYMGYSEQVASDNGSFYAPWSDNRLGDAYHANQPDVRFAKLVASTQHFSVTAAGPATAGSALSVTVTAQDAGGNLDPTYTGTVHFTCSDGTAVLPADYTFTAADAGVHTFNVTLIKAGNQTLTVNDQSVTVVTGTTTVAVSPAAADHLLFGQQPVSTGTGVAIRPGVAVQAVDVYGNITPSTAAVSVALGANPGSATLGGTTAVAAVNGVATFTDLSLNQTGTGYTLVASSGTLTGATSAAFTILNAQPATHLGLTVPPGSTAGASFSITVAALDGNNVIDPGFTGTVHFTSSDPNAVLPADYTFTAADAGFHTFTSAVTLLTAGAQTLTATSSITGGTPVTVAPAAADHLGFSQQPTTATGGAAFRPAVAVAILDRYGNVTPTTAFVNLTLGNNPGGATLGGITTVISSNGVATFPTVWLTRIGTGYTLKANSAVLTGATSASFNVTSTLIEGFENGLKSTNAYTFYGSASLQVVAADAHDGLDGLALNGGWMYRSDAAAQVKAGDTLSAWVRLDSTADGRAWFGFGAGSGGTLAVVLAADTNQLLLEKAPKYNESVLGSVAQTYQANQWYRLQVAWGTNGAIIARLYDGAGNLLNTVKGSTTTITSGGIALRASGHFKDWDTVSDIPGANGSLNLTSAATASPGSDRKAATTPAVPLTAGGSGRQTSLPLGSGLGTPAGGPTALAGPGTAGVPLIASAAGSAGVSPGVVDPLSADPRATGQARRQAGAAGLHVGLTDEEILAGIIGADEYLRPV